MNLLELKRALETTPEWCCTMCEFVLLEASLLHQLMLWFSAVAQLFTIGSITRSCCGLSVRRCIFYFCFVLWIFSAVFPQALYILKQCLSFLSCFFSAQPTIVSQQGKVMLGHVKVPYVGLFQVFNDFYSLFFSRIEAVWLCKCFPSKESALFQWHGKFRRLHKNCIGMFFCF